MKSILIGLATVFFLAACGGPILPDLTETAQLIVVYAPDVQTIRLTDNLCTEFPDTVFQGAAQGVNVRIYYGLPPGDYCLEWGDTFSAGWILRGMNSFTLVAGMAEYISVVPQSAPEEPAP